MVIMATDYYSPLEQFEILPWFVASSVKVVLLNNFSIILLVVSLIFFLFFYLPKIGVLLVGSNNRFVVEQLYNFLVSAVKQQIGLRGGSYFPVFFWIFFFIVFSNLIGLVPFSFTLTSQIILTFVIAFSFNFGLITLGLYVHGTHFFNLFVPHGAPAALIPLIVVIELVSYLLRTFSLSIRLAANMMAGHTLLHILSTFVVMFLKSKFFVFSLFPAFLVILAMGLEFGIAILQAYVFFILLTLYLNDSLTLGGH